MFFLKVAAIVCEYNPFHNGHKYHIDRTLEAGADTIVAVMSGNFVQRSESAVMPKRSRVETALRCGADLVLELPLPFATASAQRFAYGAVSIAEALGVVDMLSFGSECGDTRLIETTAEKLLQLDSDEKIKNFLEEGVSFPRAREANANSFMASDELELLHSPNDILSLEYTRALIRINSNIEPFAVKRFGAAHDSDVTNEGFASASKLREEIKRIFYSYDRESAREKIGEYISGKMPENAADIILRELDKGCLPSDMRAVEKAVLYDLRMKNTEDLLRYPDVSEGLENRIKDAANRAKSIEELYALAKTKRYTHSRIRRIVLSSLLGITKDFTQSDIPYIRVLGFNEKGRTLLNTAKKKAGLPLVTRAAEIAGLGAQAKRFFELEARAAAVYNLTLPTVQNADTEYTDAIVKV